jgi:hypothetical protein
VRLEPGTRRKRRIVALRPAPVVMAHELKNLSRLSHESLTFLLLGGLVSAIAVIFLALVLGRRRRRPPPVPREKRRSKHRGSS